MKNQLSIYHRAFKGFLAELSRTKADRKLHEALLENQKEHRAYLAKLKKAENDPGLYESILGGFSGKEMMDTVRYRCTVQTDWIEQIEFSLPYLEKAVMENRQFILQNGETVLIEQAKRIAKPSVEHLARHSEMITHEPPAGEDLIPDKIYVVENEDNYAVYENRFLYMLLYMLNEFVDARYSGIVSTWNTFTSELCMDRTVRFGKRSLKYALSLKENAENDEGTAYDKETAAILGRIRRIQQNVGVLLNTPLMREVSRVAMLKPPITRTNVLRMDTNFREAVVLYEYLTAYHGDGYTVEKLHQSTEPFSPNELEDFAEVLALFSYLTYRHGGKLEREMEADCAEEDRVLADLEEQQTAALLEKLRQSIDANGGAERYIQLLEKRNEQLQAKNAASAVLEDALRNSQWDNNEKASRIRVLEVQAHDAEEEARRTEALMERKQAAHEQELGRIERIHKEEIAERDAAIADLSEQNLLLSGRLKAKEAAQGTLTEDNTEADAFASLEKEYDAFCAYFESQWKGAKKKVRKTMWQRLFARGKKDGENA